MDRTIWELLEVTFEFVVLVNSGQELGVAELSPLYMTEDDPGEWFPFWTPSLPVRLGSGVSLPHWVLED